MIRMLNNPFQLLIEVITELYGDIKADVQFAPIDENEECVGHTQFPEDGSIPLITISTLIPFYATVEIFAHEIAHVIVGIESEHNEKWEKIFNEIHQTYMKKTEQNFNEQKKEYENRI